MYLDSTFHSSFSCFYFIIIFSPGSINVEAKLYIVNANDNKSLQLCKITHDLLSKNSDTFATLNVDSVSITNLGNVFYNIFKL